MSMTWLANVDKQTFWAHHAWTEFEHLQDKEKYVVLLPVHGFADHGLGMPLDIEETIGGALLKSAVEQAKAFVPLAGLPPLRFGLAPYPNTFFGLDADAAHDLVREIASCVQAAGFKKLAFFNTSPWNEEFIDAASRDTRAHLGLQTFVVNISGLDLDFHPASETRAKVQALGAYLLGRPPVPSTRPTEVADAGFRPGHYQQPAPVSFDPRLNAPLIFTQAAHRLAKLLAEIHARAPLGTRSGPSPLVEIPAAATAAHALTEPVFPAGYRSRYLPAFTRDEIEAIPNKAQALVLITTGAIEQHGPHMPVGVDAIMGQAWLNYTLPKLGADVPVYVAPAITFGKSNEHIGFPGTVWISAKSLRRNLLALATQIKALGFHQLALLNTHGGNSAVLVYTLREIQETLGLRAGMVSPGYKPDLSVQEATYGFHAGEWETSAMLEVTEALVKMDKAVCEFPAQLTDPGELRPEDAPAIFSWITRDVSLSGVMGDATKATPEKGRRWMEEASAMLARRIQELIQS